SYMIVFLGDGFGSCQLELTWLRDKEGAYDLGDNEIHVGFRTDDYEGALKKHKEMGCVVFENLDMGIYFIGDPDGYWMEVVPVRKPEDWK
ncbi:MAG: lactoylglutathione lyase, partial [Anaerovorax sp.]